MINITVTGDTYAIRRSLKDAQFMWEPKDKAWSKVVGEAMLDTTLESIRPPHSLTKQPKVVVTLTSVDVNGDRMREGEMRVSLQPAGERALVDFLTLFQAEVCDVKLSPIKNEASVPLKKRPTLDDGFF